MVPRCWRTKKNPKTYLVQFIKLNEINSRSNGRDNDDWAFGSLKLLNTSNLDIGIAMRSKEHTNLLDLPMIWGDDTNVLWLAFVLPSILDEKIDIHFDMLRFIWVEP